MTLVFETVVHVTLVYAKETCVTQRRLTRTEPHLIVETISTFAACRAHCVFPVVGFGPVVFAPLRYAGLEDLS